MGFLRISKESHYLLDYYYVDLVPIIVTIGIIFNSFCATIFLYFVLQNNLKYENISIYFEKNGKFPKHSLERLRQNTLEV